MSLSQHFQKQMSRMDVYPSAQLQGLGGSMARWHGLERHPGTAPILRYSDKSMRTNLGKLASNLTAGLYATTLYCLHFVFNSDLERSRAVKVWPESLACCEVRAKLLEVLGEDYRFRLAVVDKRERIGGGRAKVRHAVYFVQRSGTV